MRCDEEQLRTFVAALLWMTSVFVSAACINAP